MNLKRILCYFVFVCICFSLFSTHFINAQEGMEVNVYDASGKSSVMQINEGKSAGFLFNAAESFDSVSVYATKIGNSKGSVQVSLYKYNESYHKSIKSSPVMTQFYTDIKRNAVLSLSGTVCSRGEYLIVFHNVENKVGIYVVDGNRMGGGLLYEDGYEIEGTLKASVHFTKTANKYFNEYKSSYDLSYTVTTPEEHKCSSEDAINSRDVMADTWYAIDGLDRVLPTQSETGVQKDRVVAMAYWSWHCDFSDNSQPRNVTQIIKQYPESINDYRHSVWYEVDSPAYFWDEPIFGYYTTEDRWVIRKHAELLAAAGVDVIFFDNTNSIATWQDGYRTIFEVFAEAREDGVNAPCISFTLHFSPCEDTNTQLEELYLDIYRQDKFRELWFYWDGKPLIMAHPDALSDSNPIQKEIKEFFTFRGPMSKVGPGGGAQTSFTQWGWLNTYPQIVYKDAKGNNEMTTVGIAINWNENGITAMNGPNVMGRTWTSKGYDTSENALLKGAFFAEQWEYALKVDPEIVFVVGWNEWIAGRYEEWNGVTNAFPDQFSEMYSRDIEPTKGTLKDHYYYQLCAYIRKYKGIRTSPATTNQTTIDINKGSTQWENVGPAFYDYTNDIQDRNHVGYVTTEYTNTTGRNDIVLSKIASDTENIYFMVQTKENLTSPYEKGFMRLLIDTIDSNNSWEGFEFVVNRVSPDEKYAVLERATKDGWEWEEVGKVEYTIEGNCMQLKIPKSMLGISTQDFTFNFKWSDNMQVDGDIMDFYSNGDVAPAGRFMYHYDTASTGVDPASADIGPINTIVIIAVAGAVVVAVISVLLILLMKRTKKT